MRTRFPGVPSCLRLLLFMALTASLGARAALVWDTPAVILDIPANTREIVAHYHFKNTGHAPITITELVSNCDCTTTELTQRTYAPGDGGTLTARFAVGSQIGTQENTLAVITDEPNAAPVVLRLLTNIQSMVTLAPPVLSWRIGAEPEESSTLVSAGTPLRITSLVITETHPAGVAKARVATVTAGTHYRVFVQPASTTRSLNLAVSCSAKFTDGTAQDFVIYGLVQK